MGNYEELSYSSDSLEPSLDHMDDDFITGFDELLDKQIESKIQQLLYQPPEPTLPMPENENLFENKLRDQFAKSQSQDETPKASPPRVSRQRFADLKAPRDLNIIFDEKPYPKWYEHFKIASNVLVG
jgi:hypothetical protein